MTKKDYERAAEIVQRIRGIDLPEITREAFVELFAADNPRFDAVRFRKACQRGANVKARVG